MTIGEKLKEARHKKGLSLKEIQAELKIRTAYLEAMENDRFEDIPGETYQRAFLRTYASYLGLDADSIIEEYNTIYTRHENQKEAGAGEKSSGLLARIISVVLILLILGAAVYLALPERKSQPELPQAPLESTLPAETTEQSTEQAQPEAAYQPEPEEFNLKIEVISDKSWVEVRDAVSGKTMAAKVYSAGEFFETTASTTLTVVIGYPGAVKIYYNGREFTGFEKRGVLKFEAGLKEIRQTQ